LRIEGREFRVKVRGEGLELRVEGRGFRVEG